MEAAEKMRFRKNERLFLKNDIDRLFEKGSSFIAFPLRIVYLSDFTAQSEKSGISILISVPKKRIKHATQRNRIKRLIREAFRLRKKILTERFVQNGKFLHIAFMYISNDVRTYPEIEKAISKTLDTIQKKEQ